MTDADAGAVMTDADALVQQAVAQGHPRTVDDAAVLAVVARVLRDRKAVQRGTAA
jgi:hypothetical protein